MMQILDGKATSLAIEAELTEAVQARLDQGLKRPHLAAVLVKQSGQPRLRWTQSKSLRARWIC